MKSLKINKGWYYGAGSPRIYNWTKDGFDQAGVGIKTSLLNEDLHVTVDGVTYLLNGKMAREFVNKYGSVENRKGTSLGVISKSLFVEIYENKNKKEDN